MTESNVFINACVQPALFWNISLLRRQTLRQEKVGGFPGALSKGKNMGKESSVKALCSLPCKLLLVRCLYLAGPGET